MAGRAIFGDGWAWPLFSAHQARIVRTYVAVQLVIWAKSFVFFFLYGHGKALLFSVAAFPRDALAFDWYFHLAGHISIAILAIIFGMKMEKIELGKFAATVFCAVALHNFAYWLTYSHPNALYSVIDFATDSAILSVFVLAGHFAARSPLAQRAMLELRALLGRPAAQKPKK